MFPLILTVIHEVAAWIRFISPKKHRNTELKTVFLCQESRRSSSAARCCAPRSGAQRSSTQPGSVLQGERGSESKRCPPDRWIQAGPYCSGDLRRICECVTQVQRITVSGSVGVLSVVLMLPSSVHPILRYIVSSCISSSEPKRRQLSTHQIHFLESARFPLLVYPRLLPLP